jgi:hypothetical protein
MLIKSGLVRKNNLEEVVGGFGEDSLFSMQLIMRANKIQVENIVVHNYYAANTSSVVNNIDAKFFERYLVCEKAQVKWLCNEGLISEYLKLRFADYVEYWYLNNLEKVGKNEKIKAKHILVEICKLYLPYYNGKDKRISALLERLDIRLSYTHTEVIQK